MLFGTIGRGKKPTEHDDSNDDYSSEVKKQRFEMVLTNRKRMTRMAFVQGIFYFEERRKMLKAMNNGSVVSETIKEEVNEIYRVLIFFYKQVFFPGRYGTTRKTRRLEEIFLRYVTEGVVFAQKEVDEMIKKYLAKKWTLNRLPGVIKAALRCATYEALYRYRTEPKVIISEYTQLIAGLIGETKEVDFMNAILHNIIHEVRGDEMKMGGTLPSKDTQPSRDHRIKMRESNLI